MELLGLIALLLFILTVGAGACAVISERRRK